MSKASTVMDELAALSDSLSDAEDRIGELRDELRSFSDDGRDETFTPTTLDPAWSFDAATKELNGLLQRRHTDSAKYRELSTTYEAAKQAETKKKLVALQSRYKAVVAKLLEAACTIAHAVKEGDDLIHEAWVTSGNSSAISHCGPNLAGWSPSDHSSFVSHWLREAVRLGYIQGTEPWCKDITF